MGLDQINQAVLEAARTEADHILKAAQLAAEKKVAAGRETAEADGERRYQAACRAIEEEFARQVIQQKGGANKELLARKNAILRSVFDRAREQVLALPAGDYAAIMRKLLEGAAEGRGGKLRVHPSERAGFEQIVTAFNAGRPEALRVKIDDAQALPEAGGFVFVSEAYEVDQTLRTLLGDLERDMAPQIAAEGFGG